MNIICINKHAYNILIYITVGYSWNYPNRFLQSIDYISLQKVKFIAKLKDNWR